MRGAFEIFILVGTEAPKKCGESHGAKCDGGGNEIDYDVHVRIP